MFVVLKGMSYIGHGLSHAIFGGFAASALLGVNFVLGAGVWGVVSALLISGVTRRRAIGADAAIGVITTASFALGLALFAVFGRRGESFDAALFGSVLGVARRRRRGDRRRGRVRRSRRVLRLPPTAVHDVRSGGRRGLRSARRRVDAMLMLVLAVTILATMQVLGVTLVAATIVIPATVARMLTDSFHTMLFLAAGIGACHRVRRDEPQLPPRRPVGADDRARGGDVVRRCLRRLRQSPTASCRRGSRRGAEEPADAGAAIDAQPA